MLGSLHGHRDLGIHTELLSDGVIDLVELGVATGVRKVRRPGKVVTTFALGTKRLYDFLDGNPAVELLPVDWVNDPRVIAQEPMFVSINATTEVDFLGQAASETIAGRYWSGSGGQADFARGAMYSAGGQGFLVLRSTAARGTISRIVPRLGHGSAVTTLKNTVDKVVTEHGIAELRGRSVRERTRALVGIAHPEFRDEARGRGPRHGLVVRTGVAGVDVRKPEQSRREARPADAAAADPGGRQAEPSGLLADRPRGERQALRLDELLAADLLGRADDEDAPTVTSFEVEAVDLECDARQLVERSELAARVGPEHHRLAVGGDVQGVDLRGAVVADHGQAADGAPAEEAPALVLREDLEPVPGVAKCHVSMVGPAAR